MGFFITFLILYCLIYMFHSNDEQITLRAFLIAVSLMIASALGEQYGGIVLAIAYVVELVIIMKIMKYSFVGAFFFLTVIGIVHAVIGMGIAKYLP